MLKWNLKLLSICKLFIEAQHMIPVLPDVKQDMMIIGVALYRFDHAGFENIISCFFWRLPNASPGGKNIYMGSHLSQCFNVLSIALFWQPFLKSNSIFMCRCVCFYISEKSINSASKVCMYCKLYSLIIVNVINRFPCI